MKIVPAMVALGVDLVGGLGAVPIVDLAVGPVGDPAVDPAVDPAGALVVDPNPVGAKALPKRAIRAVVEVVVRAGAASRAAEANPLAAAHPVPVEAPAAVGVARIDLRPAA